MSYFLKNGNTYRVSADNAIDLHYTLPVGNYIVKVDQFGVMYLEQIDSFEFKGKRYGDNIKHTTRIMNTFKERAASTGVMLAGEKGSGKSLLAKSLSIAAAEEGIPTIVINSPYKGDVFNKLIQDISQPCLVLFDEFEKVYDKEDQESILTLLDGVFPSKKLFVLTCNDKYRIDSHMRNRPGRIYYMIDFQGLDAGFITEYCNDNLNDKSHIEKICSIAGLFGEFNFDMLKALVEEMNRYNESPQESLKMINAKPEFDTGSRYDLTLQINGKDWSDDDFSPTSFDGNPLNETGIRIDHDSNPADPEADWKRLMFTSASLVKIDPTEGVFVFTEGAATLTLTKVKSKAFNYNAF